MPFTPPEERRVARLEHDVEAIYDLLTDHTDRLRGIHEKLTEHDGRFDSVDGRLESVDARFESVDARFDRVDARFDRVDARFESIGARFESVDSRFDRVDATLAEILRRIPEDPGQPTAT